MNCQTTKEVASLAPPISRGQRQSQILIRGSVNP